MQRGEGIYHTTTWYLPVFHQIQDLLTDDEHPLLSTALDDCEFLQRRGAGGNPPGQRLDRWIGFAGASFLSRGASEQLRQQCDAKPGLALHLHMDLDVQKLRTIRSQSCKHLLSYCYYFLHEVIPAKEQTKTER